jgi:glycosyltransferase involved in cell wall biosynthesis
MRMTRLLIDARPVVHDPKGVGRYAYHICLQLRDRLPEDWSFQILIHPENISVFPPGFPAEFLPVPHSSEIAGALFEMPRQIRRVNPQILLKTDETSVALPKLPTVTVCHDVDQLIADARGVEPSPLRKLLDLYKRRLRRQTLQRSECVVCNSEFIRAAVQSHYDIPRQRTAVAYCAIDPRFYQLSAVTDRAAVRQKFGLRRYILAFATGDPRENSRQYPALAARLAAFGVDTCLLIGGIRKHLGPYASELEAEFQRLGLIPGRHFVLEGFLGGDRFPDLVDLYTAADFYLDLSRHEGFGMQLAEAMACGTTCISSPGGALAEVGGSHVLFVDPDNVEDIATKIKDAYDRDLQHRDNREQVEYTHKFSWDSAGIVIADVLRQTAGRL